MTTANVVAPILLLQHESMSNNMIEQHVRQAGFGTFPEKKIVRSTHPYISSNNSKSMIDEIAQLVNFTKNKSIFDPQ